MSVRALIVDTTTGAIHEGEIGCDACGMLACTCNIQRRHSDDCKFRLAATCSIPIECDHGYDVCPQCDPCTCMAGVATEDFRAAPRSENGKRDE